MKKTWDSIVVFTEKPRLSYMEIRDARPDQEMVKKAMLDLLENCKFQNCTKNEGYIRAIGMNP
jgi:endoglucanase